MENGKRICSRILNSWFGHSDLDFDLQYASIPKTGLKKLPVPQKTDDIPNVTCPVKGLGYLTGGAKMLWFTQPLISPL